MSETDKKPMTERVLLREVVESDLPLFFLQQLDPIANQMAAFTDKNPSDRPSFERHWLRLRNDEDITIKTILFEGEVAGYIVCHDWNGPPEIGYWSGRAYWGKGIVSTALAQLLQLVTDRPLFAHAAKDNLASIRVLEKNGFKQIGADRVFSHARQREVEELIFKLDAASRD